MVRRTSKQVLNAEMTRQCSSKNLASEMNEHTDFRWVKVQESDSVHPLERVVMNIEVPRCWNIAAQRTSQVTYAQKLYTPRRRPTLAISPTNNSSLYTQVPTTHLQTMHRKTYIFIKKKNTSGLLGPQDEDDDKCKEAAPDSNVYTDKKSQQCGRQD